jgi:hypothetical protein
VAPETFSSRTVGRALGDASVASCEIIDPLRASTAEVARLRISFRDGRPRSRRSARPPRARASPPRAGSCGSSSGSRPRWDHPAPRLLGACEHGDGAHTALLLVTNLFQSVLQGSAFWFHRAAALIDELDCLATLRSPPPIA